MIGSFTYLDAALLAIAFISALLAMYRGLTRELLSIVSWIIAALAVAYFWFTQKAIAVDVAQQMGTQVLIAQVAIAAMIFLIVLVVVHLFTARISDSILDSRVGMIDRIFGFLFGVARGFIIVVIPYMFYTSFFPDEEQHFPWVKNAQSKPYLRSTGEALRSTLVDYIPSSLTGDAEPEQQEGAATVNYPQLAGLAERQGFHISVTQAMVGRDGQKPRGTQKATSP